MDKGAVEKTEISQRVQGRSAGLERDRDTTRISGTTEHDHEVKLDLEANDGMGKHEESHHEPIILVHPVTAKGDLDWATDEANPRNWSSRKKWLMASIVSLYALVSPLASSMMAPALTDIARDLHITSATVSALTLSIYVLATAIGPLFLGPLSEIYGRTWVLNICNLLVMAFSVGCAYAPTTGTLIACRFLAGLASSGPVSIGGGSISDLFSERDRATAMSIYTVGPLLGPVIGPAIGGFATQDLNWRWIFKLVAIAAGASSAFGIPLLRETYAPVLLERRAKNRGKSGEAIYEKGVHVGRVNGEVVSTTRFLWVNLSRPLALLSGSFVCFILSCYMALFAFLISFAVFLLAKTHRFPWNRSYGYLFMLFVTLPQLFNEVYGWGTGISGLAYLGPGIGLLIANLWGGQIINKMYRKLSDKNGGVGKPEYRIPLMIPGGVIVPVGLLWYGWSAQARLHWIMPIIGAGIFGFGIMIAFLAIQLYLVDAFTYAASALAAATLFRSVLGFVFPLFAEKMFAALGTGGGMTLLAGVAIIVGIPFPIWIYLRGEQIRQRSKYTRT